MEEFRKPPPRLAQHTTSKRKEAWKEIRRAIEERRRRPSELQPSVSDEEEEEQSNGSEDQSNSLEEEYSANPSSTDLNKALATERSREQQQAISPAPAPAPAPASAPSKENGWNQGDGRRAEQVVIYEGNLPEAIRKRIEPAKGTHFRFRRSEDERNFLSALSSASQTAVYQSTGKKDVTLTSSDGQLLGNIHFLHMDGPHIHQPDKYYLKFYLFNFSDSNILRMVKQQIQLFFQKMSSAPSASAPSAPTRIPYSKRRPFKTYKRSHVRPKPKAKHTRKKYRSRRN